jgi:hypothetical protein
MTSASQIFVHWIDSGSTAQLTRGGESPRSLSWSPDGRWLAFAMRVASGGADHGESAQSRRRARSGRRRQRLSTGSCIATMAPAVRPEAFYQLFVIPADGGAARQLTRGALRSQRPPGLVAGFASDHLFRQSRRGSCARTWSIRSFTAYRPRGRGTDSAYGSPGTGQLAGLVSRR